MTDHPPARRSVDDAAQGAFVALSGDANPLHTDELAARRLPFGRRAVHGMHLALLALELVAEQTGAEPTGLTATFRRPVGVGDDIEFGIDVPEGAPGTATVTHDDSVHAEIAVQLADVGEGHHHRARHWARHVAPDLPRVPLDDAPAVLGIEQLAGRSGSEPLAGDVAAIAGRFPALCSRVGAVTVAELLAITRVIGMRVPGLHSMLSSFDVTIEPPGPRADAAFDPSTRELHYHVDRVDDRFSKVSVRVDGPSVHGSVIAFVRPAPVDPVVDTSIVTPGEFAGVRALVVGGSRGLGAAAVQLLAAGGAEVRFTYHRGADDAARLAAAIPDATAHQLDAVSTAGVADGLATITADGWRPTLLAWFASPPIFVGDRDRYRPELAAQFRGVYVDAFVRAVELLDPARLDAVLWPSSEAVTVDVAGLAEYANVKRLGEQVCGELAAAHPELVVHAPRFPRLRTDQTASFVPVEVDDPAAHVLAALRASAGAASG